MAENPTAGFVQDKGAELPVSRNPAGLLPECVSRRWIDSADNDIPDLSLGMATDDIDGNTWRHSISGRGSNPYLANHSHEGPRQP